MIAITTWHQTETRCVSSCFYHGSIRLSRGTGTSAMLAYLIARGDIQADREVVVEGLAGGLFIGKVVQTWRQGDMVYHTPDISSTAHVTGIHHFFIDPEDPMGEGLAFNGQ
jgi:proline racemase